MRPCPQYRADVCAVADAIESCSAPSDVLEADEAAVATRHGVPAAEVRADVEEVCRLIVATR